VHLDRAAKHTFERARNRFADNTDDQILAQFAGAKAASTLRDNSKGFAAQYTAGLANKPDQCFECELHAILAKLCPGVTGPLLFQTNLDPLQNPYARPYAQTLPTLNPNDDVTWEHGSAHDHGGLFCPDHSQQHEFVCQFFPALRLWRDRIDRPWGRISITPLTSFMSSDPGRFGANPGLADTASVTKRNGRHYWTGERRFSYQTSSTGAATLWRWVRRRCALSSNTIMRST